MASMEGRRTETADSVTPYWTLRASTTLLQFRAYDDMSAFLMEASDGGQCFLAFDIFRPRPSAYDKPLSGTRAIGGAFNGTATLVSVQSARQVMVSGLPAGFIINRGCNVGFRRSSLVRSLHRVTEDVTAGSDGIAVLKFRYGLDALFVPAGTTVDFEKPCCVMQLDAGYSSSKQGISGKFSFTAQEAFYS